MSIGLPDSPGTRLIGDIGGTNARFAIYRGGALSDAQVLQCATYPTLSAAVQHYLAHIDPRHPRPSEAAFAIAGPIVSDQIVMTNHVWRFSVSETRRTLGLDRLTVLNDFTALAMSLPYLPRSELEQIGHGHAQPNAPVALIGPGTGLGVSGLIPVGIGSAMHWIPLQGEGGHTTMAPMNERESAVLNYLHRRYSHVSAERVISGPGLLNLYEAICALENQRAELLDPAEITARALRGECRICREVLHMFTAMLGTAASNLVLTLGALGGLYIGGGIVPKLGRMFASSPFRDRFEDKGRYSDYLSAVPTYVIRSEYPAFIGLAHAFFASGPRIEAQ